MSQTLFEGKHLNNITFKINRLFFFVLSLTHTLSLLQKKSFQNIILFYYNNYTSLITQIRISTPMYYCNFFAFEVYLPLNSRKSFN